MSEQLAQTLEERGNQYGDFATHANLTQTLEKIIMQHYSQVNATQQNPMPQLPHYMAEALHMVCHKVARIVNGNIMYKDSWHDIGGYTQKVVEIIERIEAQEAELAEQKAKTMTAALEAEQELVAKEQATARSHEEEIIRTTEGS